MARFLLTSTHPVLRGLPRAARRYGIRRALRLAFAELLFDLRYGSRTGMVSRRVGLYGVHLERHEPCNPVMFHEAMDALPIPSGQVVFLDLGAGKGRAMMLAIQRGIREVIGVEVSSSFVTIARSNLAVVAHQYRTSIVVDCGDAATYAIPDRVNAIFLFNPFEGDTLEGVLTELAATLARRPRTLYVVYVYPREAARFIASGFSLVSRVGGHSAILAHYESVLSARAISAR